MADTVGVLSILEPPLVDVVRKLWIRFEQDFGSSGVQAFPHPNLTLQAGVSDEVPSLEKELAAWIPGVPPFEISVDGLGYLEAPSPAVFLRVEPTEVVRTLNRQLASIFSKHCENLIDHYQPDSWTPHITLAMGDLGLSEFERARKEFSGYHPACRQSVTNITLACQSAAQGSVQIVKSWTLSQGGSRVRELDS